MGTKICFKCNTEKPLTQYYKHNGMADGHLNKCMSCTKSDSKKRFNEKIKDPEFLKSERDRGRERYHRLGYKDKTKPDAETKKATIERYREKYPEKRAAHAATSKMKPLAKGNELHHWSYNEEHFRDVIEISVIDHNVLHRHIIYDQERRMYRTLDGVLLDTKESHLEYLRKLKQ